MKEFKVNEFITLKLENKKSNIYIKGELFQQCKFLLINIPLEEMNSLNKLDSVDDAAELLDSSLEEIEGYHYDIPPESEFWAHCSNLQVWYENDYNTRLLHSNLAFSLLQRLYEIGDPLAKKKYKEEIAKRFIYGNKKIQFFLIEQGYLDILSLEEFLSLIKDSDIITKLGVLLGTPMRINTKSNPYSYGFVVEDATVKWISLNNCRLSTVPEVIKELKSLEGLVIRRNLLKRLPEWIGDLSHLEVLDVSNNQLREIPESIGSLKKLKRLKAQHNRLKELPISIGDLQSLVMFYAYDNLIESLPETIGKLVSLKDLVLRNNRINFIPESLGLMSSLKNLDIGENPVQKLPDSIIHLKYLSSLHLKGLDKEFIGIVDVLKRKQVNILK